MEDGLPLIDDIHQEMDGQAKAPTGETENDKLPKSHHALDTLLDLADTYIGMGDHEAARQSLEEVLDHGNDKQKEKATMLIKKLD